MRMTKNQEDYLKNLTCQPLTANPKNQQLIRNFRCARNSGLASQLTYYAWDEHTSGRTTYYVIKDREDRILLYFSLKCGALFEPINREELEANIQRYRQLLELIRTRKPGVSREKYKAQLQQLEREFNMPLYQLSYYLQAEVTSKNQKLNSLDEDIAQEANPCISRVVRTYPAVELVHFVANDNAKNIWRKSGINRPMGEVLFWYFICPIMSRIRESLGCQYAYLFAADCSPDQNLVNYYDVRLHFSRDENFGTSKPVYDFTCPFLCQCIEDMDEYYKEYFDNFNPDPDDTLI